MANKPHNCLHIYFVCNDPPTKLQLVFFGLLLNYIENILCICLEREKKKCYPKYIHPIEFGAKSFQKLFELIEIITRKSLLHHSEIGRILQLGHTSEIII